MKRHYILETRDFNDKREWLVNLYLCDENIIDKIVSDIVNAIYSEDELFKIVLWDNTDEGFKKLLSKNNFDNDLIIDILDKIIYA